MNTNDISRLFDHFSDSFIAYGENPLIERYILVSYIGRQSVSHLLRDENIFPFFTTFRIPKRELSFMDIHWPQLQGPSPRP